MHLFLICLCTWATCGMLAYAMTLALEDSSLPGISVAGKPVKGWLWLKYALMCLGLGPFAYVLMVKYVDYGWKKNNQLNGNHLTERKEG